jgi:hypothetical protein
MHGIALWGLPLLGAGHQCRTKEQYQNRSLLCHLSFSQFTVFRIQEESQSVLTGCPDGQDLKSADLVLHFAT